MQMITKNKKELENLKLLNKHFDYILKLLNLNFKNDEYQDKEMKLLNERIDNLQGQVDIFAGEISEFKKRVIKKNLKTKRK